MIELDYSDMDELIPLFSSSEETLVWSCLQGEMGRAWADKRRRPTCSRILTGDFCFFAGDSKGEEAVRLVKDLPPFSSDVLLLIPISEGWEALIEHLHGGSLKKIHRYATRKDTQFDKGRLTSFAKSLPSAYTIVPIRKQLYQFCLQTPWAKDYVAQFRCWEDYQRRGLGFMVLHEGKPVGGASSYSCYQGGIEIEIRIDESHRRKGLATACAARLILECVGRGLYPSWDAANLKSLELAKKLGYTPAEPYIAYLISRQRP